MREIEIKAKLLDKPGVEQRLKKLNIALDEAKTHHDVVFCKPGQKDYEVGSIWLRIRTENGNKVTWTLKADTGRKLDSIEHELEVSDGVELEKMLRLMGYALYSDITKTRRKAQHGKIEICLDDVQGLGEFIEVEMLLDDHEANYEDVTEELWALLDDLGIAREDQEFHGYDVQLRKLQATEGAA